MVKGGLEAAIVAQVELAWVLLIQLQQAAGSGVGEGDRLVQNDVFTGGEGFLGMFDMVRRSGCDGDHVRVRIVEEVLLVIVGFGAGLFRKDPVVFRANVVAGMNFVHFRV